MVIKNIVMSKFVGDKMNLDSATGDNRRTFEKLNKLYHYTTIDILDKILESKALRCNRNDMLNDMLEHSRSLDVGYDYYANLYLS